MRPHHHGVLISLIATPPDPGSVDLPYHEATRVALDQTFLDPVIEDRTQSVLDLQALGLGLDPQSDVELYVCCHPDIIKRPPIVSQSFQGDEEVPHHDGHQSHHSNDVRQTHWPTVFC